MRRLYTLRELFRQGIRGQADLHDAIQHGDPLTRRVATLAAFWVKINNDWIFNLSGLLACNFLLAIFPILILVLAITGFVLSNIAPGTETLATDNIVRALPAGIGSVIVEAVSARLKASAGWLLVVGLVTALFAGSRLFITLENCFGVVFRLRSRDPIGQNRMAFALLLVYLVLLPLLLGTLLLPAGVEHLFDPSGRDTLGSVLVTATGVLMALLSATVLFTLIYARVPYRQRPWRAWGPNWRGAVVAAALLLVYELLFPLYTTFILNPGNYGTVAGVRHRHPGLLLLPCLHSLARRGDQLVGGGATRDGERRAWHPACGAGASLDTWCGWPHRWRAAGGDAAPPPLVTSCVRGLTLACADAAPHIRDIPPVPTGHRSETTVRRPQGIT